MSTEYELFKGKSLSSLFEDIYNNSKHNKHQLEVLVKEVTSFIKDGDMAVQLIPMIKEYLEINVKNDEQLVKLAGIVQRIIANENKGGSEAEFGLSDREKEQLLNQVKLLFDLRMGRKSSVFFGPVGNLMLSRVYNEDTQEYGSLVAPYALHESTSADGVNTQMWLGFTGGIRF